MIGAGYAPSKIPVSEADMDCREGYELSLAGACVPAPLFSFDSKDQKLFCRADEKPSPVLPTCQIVEACSPAHSANQCSAITRENESTDCTRQERTDSHGNKRIDETNCGQSEPYKITIVPKDGKPIEFHFDGKEYRADYLNAKGEKVGYIGYSAANEYMYYVNEKNHTSFATLEDGTLVTKKNVSKDAYEGSYSKDGKVLYSVQKDARGRTETSNYADGSSLTAHYNKDGDLDKETINHSDGTITVVSKTKDGHFQGTHRDKHNKVIEDVVLAGDYPIHKSGTSDPDAEYLLMRNRATGSERALAMPADIKHDHSAHFQPLAYDGNLGSLSITNSDGNTVVESSQGRTDMRSGKGVMIGNTITGEQSYLWPDGDSGKKRAVVIHPDGCGAQLNDDNTIDRWCKNIEDKAINEKLSAREDAFLKSHGDVVDRRDLTEIHRRFRGDENQLNQFYDKISQIDSAKGLSKSEKTALCTTLMHHVAYPEEIVQGRSPTCNVAVLEVEMAKYYPSKYVAFVVDAVSKDGKSAASYRTVGGKSVHFDEGNLKMSDMSGRDLASRIFQSAALQVSYYPGVFKNTADGTGRYQEKGHAAKDFNGLAMKDIAELRYQLTGEETAVCWVTSRADLESALALNKGKSVIVQVDADKAPFKSSDYKSDRKGPGAHVVLLNGIDSGAQAKARITNPWGPSEDPSASGSTVSADDLIKNMTYEGDSTIHYGAILIPGPRGKTGTMVAGVFKPF